MEVKKKKPSFGKKLKRNIKRIIRNIAGFFVSLYKKFMSLKKTVRYIIGVWVIVLLIIVILIIGSNRTAKNLDAYHDMEGYLAEAALAYVEKNEIYPNVGKKLKLDMNLLLDQKYLDNDYVTDKSCIGYSIVYYDEEEADYNIKSYLNCKHYTTKDFAKDFEQ